MLSPTQDPNLNVAARSIARARRDPQIVYVISAGFSGSTMLAMMLGSHSKGAALGETDFLMRKKADGTWRHRKWCAVCGDTDGERCPVFTRELVDAVRTDPSQIYTLLSEKLPHAEFFADAAKELSYWTTRLERPSSRAVIVHVTKSVESFTASMVTRHPSKKPLEFVANDWAITNHAMRRSAVRAGVPYIHVRYLDLVQKTDETLEKLGGLIGFTPEPQQKAFWDKEHHYLRGSAGTVTHLDKSRADKEPGLNSEMYRSNHRKIFVDEKWKKILTPAQVDRIYALPSVREENEAYGYAHPLRPEGVPLLNRVASHYMDPVIELARRVKDAVK